MRLLAGMILALVASVADAGVYRYAYRFRNDQSTTNGVPSPRGPQFILCDTASELPSTNVYDGDHAYARDTDLLYVRADGAWAEVTGGGGGGAPTDAQYWTGAADGGLSAEKNLGALATGLVLNTAGVPSAYGGASCTNQFPRSLSASGAATCASVADADLASSYSGTGACSSNQWVSTLNDNAAPTCTQPAFTSLSGTASDAQLANNYSGVGTCTNQFARALNDNAAPTCEDVASADFAAQAANAVLAGPTSGGSADPTFRALVDNDVPDTITLTSLTQIGTRAITDTTGDLPVTRLNGGSGATGSTYWRGDGTWAPAGGGGGNFVEVSLAMTGGAGMYSATVTGQAWVTSTSVITCTPLGTAADGLTVEQVAIAELHLSVSDRVAGTGFNVNVFNPRGSHGTHRIFCGGA